MNWFASGNCDATHHFGWFVGNMTGLLAGVIITMLIVSTRAYDPGVRRTRRDKMRIASQWVLLLAPYVLGLSWFGGGIYVGFADLPCYVTTLSFGTLAVIGPLLLLLMFTAANAIGQGAAR